MQVADNLRQAPAPRATGTPDQAGSGDRSKLRQAIEVLRTAGVLQGEGAQCLARAFAHQPGWGDEACQWPVESPKQCHASLQALQGGGLVKPVKLAFMGVNTTHEIVPR
ncbi:hypothetical protein D3C77_677210 [compost metagenome]